MTPVLSSDNSESANGGISIPSSTKILLGHSHPLNPLTSEEIYDISLAVRKHIAVDTELKAIKFITCSIANPPKRDVLAYLGIPSATGEKVQPLERELNRRADVDFIDVVSGGAYNMLLTFKAGEWIVDTLTKLSHGTQPQISVGELMTAESTVRNDPRVRKLAAEIGLKPENIYADGWSIGWDERFPKGKRLQQALLFARFEEHDNLYAHPLDFIPVLDSNALEVVHIDFPAIRVRPKDEDANPPTAKPVLSATTTAPPPLENDPLLASGRSRFSYSEAPQEYLPDLLAKQPGVVPSTRGPLKPLHIVQPDGVSFKMNGNEIEWQKWKMHVAFSHREGLALSTITYDDDGLVRPLIYRMSLVEMLVPYGAPEHPYSRKFAFDVGEYGIGTLANELSLGCDCLGKIHYLPGSFIGNDGHAMNIERAICIHEEDSGLLWKHSDYRPGGRSHAVRSRRLVISMVCTAGNYEYCFYYYFYQDGSIEFEVRLTGILNVYSLAPGEPAGPHATQVAPRIGAQNHQHLFSVRIDPMVDGLNNSVVESDIVPLPNAPPGSAENWAGNAFIAQEQTLRAAREGAREYDFGKDRRWTIVSPSRTHAVSGKQMGYTLGFKGAAATLLAVPGSWASRRAGFPEKSLWVVKDHEDGHGSRMWPAGRYVPQTTETPKDSVVEWIKEEESIENDDILLFLTLGTNHIPRPEDWPVMPVDNLRFTLKPVNFFQCNPALDVPGVRDQASTMAFEEGNTSGGGPSDAEGAASCCA